MRESMEIYPGTAAEWAMKLQEVCYEPQRGRSSGGRRLS